MCCFSGPVESVTHTQIFARLHSDGRQSIIYRLSLATKREVAMILPIPVRQGSGEDALTFLNLENYRWIFSDLEACFPSPIGKAPVIASEPETGFFRRTLKVVSVGAFDASYVPTQADFSRMDKRFRLPDDVWSKLPGYRDFGFAVFKLKKGKTEVHPMAFHFPSARPKSLFFPTLHIHDGEIHSEEEFDHTLYAQGRGLNFSRWKESRVLAGAKVDTDLAMKTVRPDMHVFKREIHGLFTNGDIVVKPY